MAQIKNIKKPGDLIRGASVGLAGLDKDGNVIGIPGISVPAATAGDVNKVLTVDENGNPKWAALSTASLYYHSITLSLNANTDAYLIHCVTESPDPITKDTFAAFLEKYAPDGNSRLAAIGYHGTSNANDIIMGVNYVDSGYFYLMAYSVTLSAYSAYSGNKSIASIGYFNDTVVKII